MDSDAIILSQSLGRPRLSRATSDSTLVLLLRSPTFDIGVIVVCIWAVCAVLGSHITPHDPFAPSGSLLSGPDGTHWFGSDQLGRDVFSRVIAGARSVMELAPLATALAVVTGTSLALVMGYYGGLVDEVIGRVIEATMAVPGIIISIIIILALGHSSFAIICVVAFGFAGIIARTMRVAVQAERNLDYVKAARLRGASAGYIMFVEILPNILGPLIVETTVRLGYAVFALATLTFLGFGVQPPSPDWGVQVSENYQLLLGGTDWWTVLFPALALSSLVVAINLIADSLAHVMTR